MSKRRILLIALSVIVVALLIAGAFLTGLIVIPRPTTLTISPSKFLLGPGESIMLKAILQSDSFILSGKTITWSASEGSLDKTTGEAVMYTAPMVTENTSVTITASFAGDRNYLGSSASAIGFVTPTKAAPTALSITPSTFEVESNGIVTLTATLAPPSAPSSMIVWSLDGPGTLSPAAGASVTYKAPEVKERTKVTIKATFPGTAEYLSSSATCTGYVLPLGVTARKATTLTISPSSFMLKPGEKATLTATLKDVDGNVLTGKAITWSLEGPGRLSSTTGASVTYTAPSEVSEETTVRVTAAFAGDENYLASSAISEGAILPAAPRTIDEYVLKFNSAVMTNVKFEGPITIDGRKTTKIICEVANMSVLTISRIGLSASNMVIKNVEMYVTYMEAYSPTLERILRFTGKGDVALGPIKSLTLENGTILAIYMLSKTMELTKVEVEGEYVGGSEPYKPLIFEVTEATFKNGYALHSPETYDELIDKVTKIVINKLLTPGFALTCPLEYYLNRDTNEYRYTPKWMMKTANCEALNVTIYGIYSRSLVTKAPKIILEFTGEEVLPPMYGFEKGISASVYESTEHVVYLNADRLTINEVTLNIL